MSPISLPARRINRKLIWHRIAGFLIDGAAFALSGILAFELRFDFVPPANYLHPLEAALYIWVGAKSAAFIGAKLDRGGWRYTSAQDAVRIVLANSAGSILGGLVILFLLGPWGIPRSVFIFDWMLSCLMTLGGRLVVRVLFTTRRYPRGAEGDRTRILIYGAGSAGMALLREIQQNDSLMFDVIGLIDDDLSKARLILFGKRVLGAGIDLGALVREHGVEKVFIAIPSASGQQMVRIL